MDKEALKNLAEQIKSLAMELQSACDEEGSEDGSDDEGNEPQSDMSGSGEASDKEQMMKLASASIRNKMRK